MQYYPNYNTYHFNYRNLLVGFGMGGTWQLQHFIILDYNKIVL
jgi:hypothetical protein